MIKTKKLKRMIELDCDSDEQKFLVKENRFGYGLMEYFRLIIPKNTEALYYARTGCR